MTQPALPRPLASRALRVRVTWRSVASTIAVLALLAAAVAAVRPGLIGIPFGHVIVAGQSMEPALSGGDLVITVRRDAYGPGDVVAYRIPDGNAGAGTLIVHRIVGGSATAGYVLKGDNRRTRDPWWPKPSDVLGEAAVRVPHVGLLLAYLRTPLGLASLLAAATLFFLLRGPRDQPRPDDELSVDGHPSGDRR
jgi:signal peptidase I